MPPKFFSFIVVKGQLIGCSELYFCDPWSSLDVHVLTNFNDNPWNSDWEMPRSGEAHFIWNIINWNQRSKYRLLYTFGILSWLSCIKCNRRYAKAGMITSLDFSQLIHIYVPFFPLDIVLTVIRVNDIKSKAFFNK